MSKIYLFILFCQLSLKIVPLLPKRNNNIIDSKPNSYYLLRHKQESNKLININPLNVILNKIFTNKDISTNNTSDSIKSLNSNSKLPSINSI